MTEDLYSALEVCLQALEQGADLESCLALFPALAEQLRPVLETAAQARAAAPSEIPAAALRRGRARVLQHAAELRETRHAALPFWRGTRLMRWTLTTLATVAFLLTGGTGLVFASSGSLPGDRLYPVKRGWEGVQLFFVFDPAAHNEMENRFEHERVQEIHELFSESRQTRVDFQGLVEAQQPGVWQVAGLQILIDGEASLDARIVPGSLVEVIGETEGGTIKAEQIILIQAPSVTPGAVPTQQAQPSRSLSAPETQDATGEAEHGDQGETPAVEGEDTRQPQQTESSGDPGPTETPKPDDHSGSGGGGGGDGGGDDH